MDILEEIVAHKKVEVEQLSSSFRHASFMPLLKR